jgi:hypothetical protein
MTSLDLCSHASEGHSEASRFCSTLVPLIFEKAEDRAQEMHLENVLKIRELERY